MNFIKPFLGILLLIWLISCEKEQIFKENYTFGIENRYFETIDSVKVGNQTIKSPILVGERHFFEEMFPTSKYEVVFYTSSNLIVKSEFRAISYRDTIQLTLKTDGKIEIK